MANLNWVLRRLDRLQDIAGRFPQKVIEESGLGLALKSAEAQVEKACRLKGALRSAEDEKRSTKQARHLRGAVAKETELAHEAVQAAWKSIIPGSNGSRPIDVALLRWCTTTTASHLEELHQLEATPDFNNWLEKDHGLKQLHKAALAAVRSVKNYPFGAGQLLELVMRNSRRLKGLRRRYKKLQKPM